MKIKRIDDLHASAGWRNFSFLRIETTDGIIGWSEYTEADGSRGLTAIIKGLSDLVIGQDPHRIQYVMSHLASRTIQAPGGVNQRAMAAIENALLDIKGKALGVPVYQLLGGAMRDRLRVYWSHCGTYRMLYSDMMKKKKVRTFEDVRELGAIYLGGVSLRDLQLAGLVEELRPGAVAETARAFAGSRAPFCPDDF